MLRTKILFFVLLVAGMCFRAKAQNTPLKQDLFLPQALHVHGSTLVQLPNGDWLVAWFEGSGERTAPDVAIMGARRRRGQSQWSKPFVMADVPLFPDINPVLFVDARKQLWLVWYTVLADQWETSVLKYRTSTNYLKADAPVWAWQEDIHVKLGESTPNGILSNHSFLKAVTAKLNRQGQLLEQSGHLKSESVNALWQKHQADILDKVQGKGFVRNGQDENGQKQPMGYPLFSRIGWQTRHKPLQIGGKILLPLYSDGLEMSLVAMTEDFGKNWTYSEPIVGIANIQAALLPKNNGHIVAYMRDNGPPPQRLPVSTSTDGGLTWSDVTDSDLPNPGSGADAVRLANGHWALIGNDTDEGRHRLAVFLSEDEGKTWPYKRYLERTNDEKTGVRAHYPAIVQGQDGKLYACYTLQQNNQRTIRFAAFDEQWLKTPTQ